MLIRLRDMRLPVVEAYHRLLSLTLSNLTDDFVSCW